MDAEYICSKLRKIVEACYNTTKGISYSGTYARKTEDGLFTFGTRKPLTRNTVTKRIALFLILNKLPEDEI